jgi:hypothetical protein
MKKELILGAGSSKDKRLSLDGSTIFDDPVTLDINADHNPDVVWDMNQLPLPFAAESFDEIHAYEVLEHCGRQGDYKFFFDQFTDFWRLLKPNGHMLVTVPSPQSVWALGDPSHTRIIQKENLVFLNQAEYESQVGKTPMSDFRYIYKVDFRPVALQDDGEVFWFILKREEI